MIGVRFWGPRAGRPDRGCRGTRLAGPLGLSGVSGAPGTGVKGKVPAAGSTAAGPGTRGGGFQRPTAPESVAAGGQQLTRRCDSLQGVWPLRGVWHRVPWPAGCGLGRAKGPCLPPACPCPHADRSAQAGRCARIFPVCRTRHRQVNHLGLPACRLPVRACLCRHGRQVRTQTGGGTGRLDEGGDPTGIPFGRRRQVASEPTGPLLWLQGDARILRFFPVQCYVRG